MELWKHQSDAIETASRRNNYALFFEQGTGKTVTAIRILEEKCRQQDVPLLPTIILCPPIVIDNWKRELLLYSRFPAEQIVTLKGPGKKRAEKLATLAGASIVVTNYEALNMAEVFQGLLDFQARCIIFDESHKLKDISSKRTQRAVTLSASTSYRYILSGTPVVNSPFDLFSQFLAMDGGAALGKKYQEFRARYFYDENAGKPKHCYFPAWVLRTGSLDEINKIINANASRVKKSECLDLPPLVRQRVYVDLNEQQERVYDDIEKHYVSEIDGNVVSTDMALKQLIRQHQITSGFVKMDDGTTRSFEGHAKQKALEEVLSAIPEEKIIIWCVYKRDYADVRKVVSALGLRSVEIHGEVSETQKSHSLSDFERGTDGTRVLIGHPASAGIGINLVHAPYAIFYSRGFSLENDLQAEARNYRGGSEIHEKITRIDIIARGTVDEEILDALEAKQNVSEVLIKKRRKQ